MATNPQTVLPQTSERNPLAVLREEGIAKMVAALKTREATLDQLKEIAKEHSIEITNEDALKQNIAYTRIPGSDLNLVGEFLFDTPSQAQIAPVAARAQSYDPTFQERAYRSLFELATQLGSDDPQYYAERIAGRRGGDISLLDLTPLAAFTDVPTGISEVKRGITFNEPGTAVLGGLQTILGGAEAIPLVGGVVKVAKPGIRSLVQSRPFDATTRALTDYKDYIAGTLSRTRNLEGTEDITREVIERLDPSQVPPTPMQQIVRQPELPPTRLPSRPSAPTPRPDATPSPATIPVTPQRQLSAQQALDEIPTSAEPTVDIEFAGNINLSKIESVEDLREVLQTIARTNDEFIEARRGVLSIPEIQDLADKVSLETLIGRKVGQALNAEEIIAAGRAVTASAEDVIRAARAARAAPDDENLKNAALQSILRLSAFQEQFSGASAEIGRALRVLRETRPGQRTEALRAIVGDITKLRDNKNIDETLDLISRLDDPAVASKMVQKITKPTFKDKVVEIFVNGLLAGPRTHAVNILSNTLTALQKLPEEALTSVIGSVTRSADRVTGREVAARSIGLIEGTKDGLRAATKVIRGQEPDISKVELERTGAIGGRAGKLVRLPTTALKVEDEFFKGLNRRSELAAEAYRLAHKEAQGNVGELNRLYREYLDNPTDEMMEQANNFALYQTFQNPLTGWTKSVQDFANKHPYFRIIAPFIRTPVNILTYARDRSLLAPFTRKFWKEIRAGGRRRDRAIAQLSLGTGVIATISSLWGQGLVTGGGPKDPGQRSALLATGWQPYSFKIGNKYYSYGRLEPVSTVMGVTADFMEIKDRLNKEEADDIGVVMTLALASNIFDKTFLTGISQLVEAITDPDRYGSRYLENLALSFLPNVGRQVATAIDPTLRETETLSESLQARIPGLSSSLRARLDPWGDEITRTGYTQPEDSELWKPMAVVMNTINPIFISEENLSSPVKTEVARLGMKISRPRDTVTFEGIDIPLTPAEHRAYIQVSGQAAKEFLDQAVNTSVYKELSEEEKKEFILDTLRSERQKVRELITKIAIKRLVPSE